MKSVRFKDQILLKVISRKIKLRRLSQLIKDPTFLLTVL